MALRGVKGATTVKENDSNEIIEETKLLLQNMMEENNIVQDDMVSIIFTVTKDINAAFPAVGARNIGITEVPLMCMTEIEVPGSLAKCIRILIHINSDKKNSEITHVYIKGATVLRPDLAYKKSKRITIAIDGPAGSGKSTVSKAIAKKMNLLYLDTGAMYRSAAYAAINEGIDLNHIEKIIEFSKILDMKIKYLDGNQHVYIKNKDVSGEIRTPEISMAASKIAAIPEIRLRLVEIQRKVAQDISLVMDGRDIGTYVLPDANVKIFLTASPEERAQRRLKEENSKGISSNYEDVLKDIIERDKNDSSRSFAPLVAAEDAIVLDTTNMNLDSVIDKILGIIKDK